MFSNVVKKEMAFDLEPRREALHMFFIIIQFSKLAAS